MSRCRPVSSCSLFPLHRCRRGLAHFQKKGPESGNIGGTADSMSHCVSEEGESAVVQKTKNNGDMRLHPIRSRRLEGKRLNRQGSSPTKLPRSSTIAEDRGYRMEGRESGPTHNAMNLHGQNSESKCRGRANSNQVLPAALGAGELRNRRGVE
jgi:hypothetical protein